MGLLLTELIAKERQKDRERDWEMLYLLQSIPLKTEKPVLSRRIAAVLGAQLVRLGTKLQTQNQLESANFSMQDSNCG